MTAASQLVYVEFEFGTIHVDGQLPRTAGQDGDVFASVKRPSSVRTIDSIAPVVMESVQQHVAQFGVHEESGLIFTAGTGRPVSPGTVQAAWRRATQEVGTYATPHDLRHYFASVHIAGRTSITRLSRMLGHTSETLDTYGHLMGDEAEHARQLMRSALTKPSDSKTIFGRRG